MEQSKLEQSKLTNSEVNRFGVYGLASSLGIMVPMSYLTIFLTENIMMSAALMGTILLVARIIDFAIGLSSGGIIEKVKLKDGKYRSWFKILRWVVLIGVFMQFVNTSALPPIISITIVFIGYLMLHGSMNFLQTSQFGIVSMMAGPSMEDRNRLSFRNFQFAAAGQIIISAVALPAINILTPVVGNTNAYTLVATLGALMMFLGATSVVKVSKTYDVTAPQNDGISTMPQVSFGDMIKSVVTNSQMLVVMLAQVFFQTGMQVAMGIMAYYFMFVLGNLTLMALAMTITTIFGLVGSIIGPKFGTKLGKKNAMVVGLLVFAIANIAIMLFATDSIVVYVIFACLYTVGMYFFMSFGQLYFLDCGEYGLWKTGKDNRAVALSMGNMPIKIGMALGGALGAYGLQAIGYTPGMTSSAEFASNFMYLFGGLPAILTLLGAIIMFFGYKLKDSDCELYAKENAKRMEAL